MGTRVLWIDVGTYPNFNEFVFYLLTLVKYHPRFMYVDGSYLEVFLFQNILGKQTHIIVFTYYCKRHESEIHKNSWEVFF